MLPFVFIDGSMLGPFNAFGLCCAIGFFAWNAVAMRRVRTLGYDTSKFNQLLAWMIGVGLPMAWLVDVVFYGDNGALALNGGLRGFSSTGGLLGATLGALLWSRVDVSRSGIRLRPTALPLLPFSDIVVSTNPVAWAFGRLGCALIHDHPGIVLHSPFAVAWPVDENDGTHHVFGPIHVVWGSVPRFDMGLIECVLLFVLAAAFAVSFRWRPREGTYTAAGCIAYPLLRFGLDFLRPAEEMRHGALTFAQWWCIGTFALGVWLARRVWRGRIVARDAKALSAPA
jgi:phosphatidylglycerol:prolipoprotein diacylglycerol transferase